MFCPKCGKENPDGAKFCTGCGYQFPAAQTTTGSAQAPQPAPSMPAVPPTPQAPSIPPVMASAPAPAAAGLTAQTRRIILVALASVILVIACFVPVFKANGDLYDLSNTSANVVSGLSSFSTALGGQSYDSSSLRVGESYSLFSLDDYASIARKYQSEVHFGGDLSTDWPPVFLLAGIACCALFAIGIVKTIAKGKCGFLAAFSCSVLVLYLFIPTIFDVNIEYYVPDMDGIAWFMMIVALAEAVLAIYYAKSGLIRDAA